MLASLFLSLAGSAHAATMPNLGVGQSVHLTGTNLYCFVLAPSGSAYVACELTTLNGKYARGGSFTFAIGDKAVAVGLVDGRTTKTIWEKAQPALHLGAPQPAGKTSVRFTIKLGDQMAIAKTHVTLVAGRNSRNEPSLLALIPDSTGNPAAGTYFAGISAKRLAIDMMKNGTPTMVFARSEP